MPTLRPTEALNIEIMFLSPTDIKQCTKTQIDNRKMHTVTVTPSLGYSLSWSATSQIHCKAETLDLYDIYFCH